MTRNSKPRRQRPQRNGALTITRHTRTICPSTGKLRLRDSHQAAHALQSARRSAALGLFFDGQTNRREASYYRCDSCKGFHLTSEVYRDPAEWARYCQARWEAERRGEAAADAAHTMRLARTRITAIAAVHAAAAPRAA